MSKGAFILVFLVLAVTAQTVPVWDVVSPFSGTLFDFDQITVADDVLAIPADEYLIYSTTSSYNFKRSYATILLDNALYSFYWSIGVCKSPIPGTTIIGAGWIAQNGTVDDYEAFLISGTYDPSHDEWTYNLIHGAVPENLLYIACSNTTIIGSTSRGMYYGTVVSSSAIKWLPAASSSISSSSTYYLPAIDTFVLQGRSAWYSTDGITYHLSDVFSSSPSLVYTGAAASDSVVVYSAWEGILCGPSTKYLQQVNLNADMRSVAYSTDFGVFVAVGSPTGSSYSYLYKSSDGTHWEVFYTFSPAVFMQTIVDIGNGQGLAIVGYKGMICRVQTLDDIIIYSLSDSQFSFPVYGNGVFNIFDFSNVTWQSETPGTASSWVSSNSTIPQWFPMHYYDHYITWSDAIDSFVLFNKTSILISANVFEWSILFDISTLIDIYGSLPTNFRFQILAYTISNDYFVVSIAQSPINNNNCSVIILPSNSVYASNVLQQWTLSETFLGHCYTSLVYNDATAQYLAIGNSELVFTNSITTPQWNQVPIPMYTAEYIVPTLYVSASYLLVFFINSQYTSPEYSAAVLFSSNTQFTQANNWQHSKILMIPEQILIYEDYIFVFGLAGSFYVREAGRYSLTTDPSNWPIFYNPDLQYVPPVLAMGVDSSGSLSIVASGNAGGVLFSKIA